MISRRKFVKRTVQASSILLTSVALTNKVYSKPIPGKPVVISTWRHGLAANEAAWKILDKGGRAVDAVQEGVMVSESDPEVSSVGYGGFPDREGNVTLDACIMDEYGNAGSVAYLKNIKNPIAVARKVMDLTPHVMLVGDGALQFAKEAGFEETDLLTAPAREAWNQWRKDSIKQVEPWHIDEDNHDTIGMVALDAMGNISGACTTSGLAWKLKGRVGDSPIIGAGMFIDNEVGGAAATGVGEEVIKICGSFLIVELMRQGRSPQEACEEAVNRIARKQKNPGDFQVAFIALNKKGETGAYAVKQHVNYALMTEGKNELIDTKYLVKNK